MKAIRCKWARPGGRRDVTVSRQNLNACVTLASFNLYWFLSTPHAWQNVSLDFIEGLPHSSGFDCILVVVDKFSKYAHFVALAHPFTAFDVALAYLNNIYKLHGLPHHLISD
jgi:hypothetical protein